MCMDKIKIISKSKNLPPMYPILKKKQFLEITVIKQDKQYTKKDYKKCKQLFTIINQKKRYLNVLF